MAIADHIELQQHLRWAMRIEMLTIPPYLYAMYSLEDQAGDPAALIRSVVAEEMLHLALAANLLLSVGGSPRFYDRELITTYPGAVPHHDPELIVGLAPCSPELIRDVFMPIEQPSDLVEHHGDEARDQYSSLGEFYLEIEQAIDRLAPGGLFADPQVDRQLGDPSFYGAVRFDAEDSGGLVAVIDAETAEQAIETIVHQGEGLRDHHWADPSHQELTHYYKFAELADGTVPLGSVLPATTNPKVATFGPAARPAAELFNAAFSYVLVLLDELYSPLDDAARGPLVGRLYNAMSGLMSGLARYLVRLPLEDGSGRNAGPTFEFHEFQTDDPLAELVAMASRLAEMQPELASVAGAAAAL